MELRARLLAALAADAPPSSDFDLNPDWPPPAATLRRAGVLAAFRAGSGNLILTKRASCLRHHPGQIALPGGKLEDGDRDETAAALREADEEIGLDPGRVEVLGRLPLHRTSSGFAMVTVVGLVDGPFTPVPGAGEVDEVFEVPFEHVANPAHYRIERRPWREGWRNYYAAPWGPYYIWGATARVLRAIAVRLEP